jgi:tryptophan 2,3-dioxygenase
MMEGSEQQRLARELLEKQRAVKNPPNPALHEKQLRTIEILAGLKKQTLGPALLKNAARLDRLRQRVTLRSDLIPELIKALESAQGDRTSPLAAEVT